eukprot:TRINITY_DN5857_c0_g2_i3.p1 TRINITY_DN5857_c0_g2~~TRINITY_DN5857_c0_g2_i3.p1  ORF type:complete len:490 (+),score=107.73 TRINITY_DN5857_c0_g2_i3:98-1567(+)
MASKLVLVVLAAASLYTGNSLRVPQFHADNMVLQRSPSLAVVKGWTSSPGDPVQLDLVPVVTADATAPHPVTLRTHGDSESAVFEFNIPPQQAGGPYNLTLSSVNSTLSIANVMFGDVFLCSGQSNMEFFFNWSYNATEELNDVNYPNLRMFQIPRARNDTTALDDVTAIETVYDWGISSRETLSTSPPENFAAPCYFFGRNLIKKDPSVPIGLIGTTYGGTSVLEWSSADALAQCNLTVGGYRETLWNAMAHPFTPLRLAGFLWYQGEADANNPDLYRCTFPALIEDWRAKWNLPDLPFGFVQLAAFPDMDFSEQRWAQASALKLKNTMMATAVDLGDPDSPHTAIHPRNKQEVGRRLFLAMSNLIYDTDYVSTGPTPESAKLISSSESQWTIRISFSPSSADQLSKRGTEKCWECCSNPGDPFQALEAGVWVNVTSSTILVGTNMIDVVHSSQIIPTQIRAEWGRYPQCALYNSANIVAFPFILDVE